MNRAIQGVAAVASAAVLAGCSFTPYDLPLPGGADVGDESYDVEVEFRDVLDLVPHSAVRVDDVAVGRVTDIQLDGWTARVTLRINGDVTLPDDAEATIRQTNLLGEKFVSLAAPEGGGTGELSDGDVIALDRSGRNPEIEEVLSAASMLFNGGALEKTNTIVKELNLALGDKDAEVRDLISVTSDLLGQLDDNSDQILAALEKVDRLAQETNAQRAAITGALDDLPEALEVLDQQRSDLVGLLESLDRLGDTATGVVRESKADTVATLQHLEPVLANLVEAGDSIAQSAGLLLTFPFSDGYMGGTVERAAGRCSNVDRAANTGVCAGDYGNLSMKLEISAAQVQQLFDGFGAESIPGLADLAPETPLTGDEAPSGDLLGLVEGLLPPSADDEAPAVPGDTPREEDEPRDSKPSPRPTASPSEDDDDDKPSGVRRWLNPLCWFGSCRTVPAADDTSAGHDLDRLFTEAVTAP
ncbi:MCE family protein [Aeromicrobium sp. YIM 150415]|uniref:MCE family protein n=1 Tax=Aeromicrobium sp. YIM 150415 TaxID=2803912 RepID=UPI00196480A5|nr:MCE family protein [Aeromicrobium sp. YIM 150415]MBM9464871.1 MCE family protein [Aeromicrobium sp. YIM 150415]